MIRPRLRIVFVAVFCFNLAVGLAIHAQAARAATDRPVKAGITLAEQKEPRLLPGVVVEKVERNSEAEKAGLREGDVILSWSRGDQQEKVESPFDIAWLDIEQRPRGVVTVQGFRDGQVRSWKLSPVYWSLDVRPNFSGALLRYFQDRNKKKKTAQGAEQLISAANHPAAAEPAWLRSWLLLRAADSFQKAGQWQKAHHLYQRAEEHAMKCDPRVQAEILAILALAYRDRTDSDYATSYYQKALDTLRKAGNEDLSVARALMRIGFRKLFQLEDIPSAESYLRQALEIQQKLVPGQFDIGLTLTGLGEAANQSGNLSQANEYLAEARILQEPFGNNAWLANTLTIQGHVAFSEGNLEKAEKYTRDALTMQETFLPLRSRIALYDALGIIALYRDDLKSAEVYFRRVLSFAKNVDPQGLLTAYVLSNLGVTVREEGHFFESRKYLNHAIVLGEKLAPRGRLVGRAYGSLATLDFEVGDFSAAEIYFKRALAVEQTLAPQGSEVISILNELGALSAKRGNLKAALEYYGKAEKIAPKSIMHVETVAALAQLMHRENRLIDAEKFYQQALEALENEIFHLGGGDQNRSVFRANRSDVYRGYVRLLISEDQTRSAFDILERSRARNLLEVLSSGRVNVRNGVDEALLERRRNLFSEINARSDRRLRLMGEAHNEKPLKEVDEEIADLLAQSHDLESQIRATSPAYAALIQPQPLTAKEIQSQLLDENTLLLEYSLGEERSYVFAVTPDSLQAFELPKRAVVERAARRVYSLLTARNVTVNGETATQKQSRIALAEAQYPHAAAELSKMLLGPVAAQLQSKRLLVVTDGALAYIPFSVLPEPQNPPADPIATPLMVHHEIVNLPSASVLAVLRQQELGRKPAPKAVAVLADPVFDRRDSRLSPQLGVASLQNISQTRSARVPSFTDPSDPLLDPPSSLGLLTRSATDVGLSRNGAISLPRLRFSRREAEEIMAVTPPGEGKEAVDFEASRAMATSPELSQYRIVHFATHGLLDSVHPELSGLVFSMVDKNGRPQNGFLELQDIYNLNLPADLVVLSACETGLGKEISGEGLVGLTRGFMYAGASRVMASLWKVSDSGTAALMAEFYRAMEKDNLSPAAALRAAQIKMWQQQRWRNPYYWAAFQIQGEFK